MSINISVKLQIKNGRHVTEANANKLFALSKKGALAGHVTGTNIDLKNYIPRYAFVKEAQGWIAREQNFNFGICGHRKTLREQVIAVALGGRQEIVFED